MHTPTNLQQLAINAAKQQNWEQAIEANQQILDKQPADIGALNRLGVAQMQSAKTSAAKATFHKVLELDRSNSIAKKHLARLKDNIQAAAPTFSMVHFIEEPGKTRIVELHRLAGKATLDLLAVGQLCELKPKSRYISVESQGSYIGSLPEDLSFRLAKLIATGNDYNCFVHAISQNSCSVFIKETLRSEKNQYVHSFPVTKGSLATINDIDQSILFEDNIPVQTADSDSDSYSEDSLEILDNDES